MRVIITLALLIVASAAIGYALRESHKGIAQVFYALSVATAVLFVVAFFQLI